MRSISRSKYRKAEARGDGPSDVRTTAALLSRDCDALSVWYVRYHDSSLQNWLGERSQPCDLASERLPAREFSLPLAQPQRWKRALDRDDLGAEALEGEGAHYLTYATLAARQNKD